MKKVLIVVTAVLVMCSCNLQKENRYVASTSWVASFAQMAGIQEVSTLAPANLRHPPEYEITPDDMLKVSDCELFMYAGYERMMKTISVASEIDENKVLQVKTTNTEENIIQMINMLAEKSGTQAVAEKNLVQYSSMINDFRCRVKNEGLDKKKFYVNVNQVELARDAGLTVCGTFGPSPLTSSQIEEIATNNFDYIIDNYHNPVAEVAKSLSPDTTILIWKNFPDSLEENALYNLIKNNLEMLF